MGVYIRGMDMPTSCVFCPVSNSIGCGLTNPPFCMTTKEMLADRPDWCPLVSIPTHGRLIDADALGIPHDICDGAEAMEFVDAAPTVIPAEEGE